MEESLKNINFKEQINAIMGTKDVDLRTYSPLTLAYVGDAVYDLIIRTLVVEHANQSPNNLHKIAVKYVSAKAQCMVVEAIAPMLTEEEESYYRRGKNGKPHSTAKNATVAEYHRATGFEALIGFLYLSGRNERMLELIKTGIEAIDDRLIK